MTKSKGLGEDKVIREVISDLNSMRTVLCWLLFGLFFWVVAYATVKHPETIQTSIVTLGTLCGSMFAMYVGSKAYEKVNKIEELDPPPGPGLSSGEQ